MIEQHSEPQSDLNPLRQVLAKTLAVLAVLALAGVVVILGLYMGRRIVRDDWAILITAMGLATYTVIALINPRHALFLWIITAPFARFIHLDLELGRGIPNLTLNRFMAGVLLVLILAQGATRRRKLVRLNTADVLLLIFCGAAALSVPTAVIGLKSAAQSFFDVIIIPAIIYFLARNLITSRRELEAMMKVLLIVGLYLGLLATREQLTGDVWFYTEGRIVEYTRNIRRVVGLLGNPAYTAVTIDMAVPWAWYLLLNARRHRLWYWLAIGAMAAGTYYCMNRSGWVGLLLSLVVMALFVRRFRRIFLVLLILGAIVASMYWAMIVTSTTVQERLQAQGPLEFRAAAWDVAWRMLKANPLFGIGYNNYAFYYKRYGHWDIYLRAIPSPHNTYLWIALMGGLVAFIPFMLFLLALFFSALGECWRPLGVSRGVPTEPNVPTVPPDQAEIAGVFLASMAAILAPALVMDVLTGYYNTMIMFLIMGAFLGMVSGEREHLASARLRNAQQALVVRKVRGEVIAP